LRITASYGTLTPPSDTEAGHPGEQPAKGYPGAAHRDSAWLEQRTIEPAATTDCSRLE